MADHADDQRQRLVANPDVAPATPGALGEATATTDPHSAGAPGALEVGGPLTAWSRFLAFKQAHHVLFEVAFFFAGFTFDLLLLHRIDSTPLLIHQGSYLLLSAFFIGVDHRIQVSGKEPAGLWGKVFSVRTWVIHFLLGTLLNAFVVFYFRSTSVLSASSVFMGLLVTVLVLNEMPRFRQKGPVVRVALLSFATTSYFAYLLPVLAGRLHWSLFGVAVALGSLATFGLWRVYRRVTHDPQWTLKRAVVPGLVVQALLLGLYLGNVLPPVPLAIKHLGIYHQVERLQGERGAGYALSYLNAPAWKFWSTRETDFTWREGDKAWAFVQVFAPDGFKDTLAFRWQVDDAKRGWVDLGGPSSHELGTGGTNREQGFRTYAYATIGRPGRYRVLLLASDGRELGRETFEAIADSSVDPDRGFKVEVR